MSSILNISSKNLSSSSLWAKNPDPLFLPTTVPEGHPKFKFISLYPNCLSFLAVEIKPSESLVSICGTKFIPLLFSGKTSLNSLVLRLLLLFGTTKGAKYLSIPPKNFS